jgi:hypothetical protein
MRSSRGKLLPLSSSVGAGGEETPRVAPTHTSGGDATVYHRRARDVGCGEQGWGEQQAGGTSGVARIAESWRVAGETNAVRGVGGGLG